METLPVQNTPLFRNQFPRERGAIIVTPAGEAYFPSARRMTPQELADWIGSLSVTLPVIGPATTAFPRGPFDMAVIRDCEADAVTHFAGRQLVAA